MSVTTDHVTGMPNVKIHLGHSHVPVTLDTLEMGLLVKVRS